MPKLNVLVEVREPVSRTPEGEPYFTVCAGCQLSIPRSLVHLQIVKTQVPDFPEDTRGDAGRQQLLDRKGALGKPLRRLERNGIRATLHDAANMVEGSIFYAECALIESGCKFTCLAG